MSTGDPKTRDSFFLPKFRHVQWTWRRWLLLGVAALPFADQFIVPISRWNGRQEEGLLFLVIAFRVFASAEPPLPVVAASASLAVLSGAMARGVVSELSPVWTPIAFALLIFLFLTWRWGRKETSAGSK